MRWLARFEIRPGVFGGEGRFPAPRPGEHPPAELVPRGRGISAGWGARPAGSARRSPSRRRKAPSASSEPLPPGAARYLQREISREARGAAPLSRVWGFFCDQGGRVVRFLVSFAFVQSLFFFLIIFIFPLLFSLFFF